MRTSGGRASARERDRLGKWRLGSLEIEGLDPVLEEAQEMRGLARRGGSGRLPSSTAWTGLQCVERTPVRTPRPGPISSTTSAASSSASRTMTPRMFSSTRKCWPSDLRGGGVLTRGANRMPRSRCRRSAPLASQRRHHASRRVQRAYGARWPARLACRGAAAERDTDCRSPREPDR